MASFSNDFGPHASSLRLASRSIWKERYTRDFAFICPLCTCPRRIGMHPKPGQPIHFVQVGLSALVFAIAMQAMWPWIGLRGLVTFIPLWIAFEVVYRAKVRASLVCKKCGFDPVLYLSDVERSREVVREHWRKRFEEKGIPFPETPADYVALRLQGSRGHASASNASSSSRAERET